MKGMCKSVCLCLSCDYNKDNTCEITGFTCDGSCLDNDEPCEISVIMKCGVLGSES